MLSGVQKLLKHTKKVVYETKKQKHRLDSLSIGSYYLNLVYIFMRIYPSVFLTKLRLSSELASALNNILASSYTNFITLADLKVELRIVKAEVRNLKRTQDEEGLLEYNTTVQKEIAALIEKLVTNGVKIIIDNQSEF